MDTNYLLRFIDFIYAVIISFALKNTYEFIDSTKTIGEKTTSVLLFFAAVYFIVDDWLDARALTEINKYPPNSFRRFIYDVLIAFLAYGALFYAQQRNSKFVLCITLIMVMVFFWIRRYKAEKTAKMSLPILNVGLIMSGFGFFLFSSYYLWQGGCHSLNDLIYYPSILSCIKPQIINFYSMLYFWGALFVWLYARELAKLNIPNNAGTYFGPSAPFISHETLRNFFANVRRFVMEGKRPERVNDVPHQITEDPIHSYCPFQKRNGKGSIAT